VRASVRRARFRPQIFLRRSLAIAQCNRPAQAATPAVPQTPQDELKAAYYGLNPMAQEKLRQWWKESGLPVGATIADTFSECPPVYLEDAFAAIDSLAVGEIPAVLVTPALDAEWDEDDGGDEAEGNPQERTTKVRQ
jgi:hypothetical protein